MIFLDPLTKYQQIKEIRILWFKSPPIHVKRQSMVLPSFPYFIIHCWMKIRSFKACHFPATSNNSFCPTHLSDKRSLAIQDVLYRANSQNLLVSRQYHNNSINKIQLGSEELWPEHGFPVYVHCDLDLRDMTMGQGHDTPLGHGQQLCEILSRSNLAVRSYGLETDFQYVCTAILTLEIWPWVKVMTHPWIMDNNYVKYYPDPTWQWEVMARTGISSMCALWPWPWRYDLGSRSWHTLGSWTTVVWNIIQI